MLMFSTGDTIISDATCGQSFHKFFLEKFGEANILYISKRWREKPRTNL